MNVATEQDREKVKAYLNEAVKAEMRKNEEAENVRDILQTLKQDHDLEPKLARKVISSMVKGNAVEVKEQNDAFSDLVEIVGV